MKTPEGRLKDQVKAYLDALPRCYRYMPVPYGYGTQSLDFICCINGRFVGIECKAPGKKPTPRQELCMRQIREADGVAIWIDNIGQLAGALYANMVVYA